MALTKVQLVGNKKNNDKEPLDYKTVSANAISEELLASTKCKEIVIGWSITTLRGIQHNTKDDNSQSVYQSDQCHFWRIRRLKESPYEENSWS